MAVRIMAAVAASVLWASGALAAEEARPTAAVSPVVEAPASGPKPLVQIAILLDTSGSMSGLIDQARTELWSLVNEFILAEQQGRKPEVQVALYEYGNNGLSAETGWIRQIVPLTTDLDTVSEKLFALTTNGGDEYCGWVIREATQKLAWSARPNDLKVIFIAGNEPFTQGPVDYRESCKAAIAKGIVVNTIHCGTEFEGINGKWKDGAVLADGRSLNIDHNHQVVHIPAPQDVEIAALSVRLNDTYIPYGQAGQVAQERQMAQDNNAAQASPQSVVQRAVTKSSSNYVNTGWDLVDAVKAGQVDLKAISKKDLPEAIREMNAEQRRSHVAAKAAERAEVQARIQKLNEQRNQFVAEEMAKQQQQPQTLGSAMKRAIREQAATKNYTFTPANPPSEQLQGTSGTK
jgi:hypothetical protein